MLYGFAIDGTEDSCSAHQPQQHQHRYQWNTASAANPINGLVIDIKNAAYVASHSYEHHFHGYANYSGGFGSHMHGGYGINVGDASLPTGPRYANRQHQGYTHVSAQHSVYGQHQGYVHVPTGSLSHRR